MKTPSSGWEGIRKRSPRRAPPERGLCGSQARTATLNFEFWLLDFGLEGAPVDVSSNQKSQIDDPKLRTASMSLPVRLLLPTPAPPVRATTRAGLPGVEPRRARISSDRSPRARRLSSRLRARR